ncbi:hypothetical protein [Roseburia faecis]|uniref:hypothetical protein n=1 Tax=Roseburia faecis TaxID=301302 RepID=UPI0032EBAC2E
MYTEWRKQNGYGSRKKLTNEEVIRELLELLRKNAMKEQANDVFEMHLRLEMWMR